MGIIRSYTYSIVEENQNLEVLKGLGVFLENSNVAVDKFDTNKIIQPKHLPKIFIKKNHINKDSFNANLNNILKENHFDYIKWRKMNGFQDLCFDSIRISKDYQIPVIENFNEIVNYFFDKSNSNSFFGELAIFIQDIINNYTFILSDIGGYYSFSLPLIKKTAILIDKKHKNFHFFYYLHELGHCIVNFLQYKYNIVLSIEEEEYWAHFFESCFFIEIYPKWKNDYEVFLSNILQENIFITLFQTILFKNPNKYKSSKKKKNLYQRLAMKYSINIPKHLSLEDCFDFSSNFFYSGAYINGQKNARNNLNIQNLGFEEVFYLFIYAYV